MSHTGALASCLVGAYTAGGRIFLKRWHTDPAFQTPYDLDDWADEPLETDRVIWACLSELGWAEFALQANPRPNEVWIGRYTPVEYARALTGILGPLAPWLAALDADMGFSDLEHAKAIWENKSDATTDDFALLGLPSHMIMMQILFGTQEV